MVTAATLEIVAAIAAMSLLESFEELPLVEEPDVDVADGGDVFAAAAGEAEGVADVIIVDWLKGTGFVNNLFVVK